MKSLRMVSAGMAVGALAGAAFGGNGPLVYQATFTELNNSGVTGNAQFSFDMPTSVMSMNINASGLEANMPHMQTFNGLFDGDFGTPIDSTTPGALNDTDGDGFIEFDEGATSFGESMVNFTMINGEFPSTTTGDMTFNGDFDLSDMMTFNEDFNIGDMMPFDLRTIVLYGMSVDPGVGDGTPGEVNGTGGYLMMLPIAVGEFVLIPAPSTLALLGLPTLALARRRR